MVLKNILISFSLIITVNASNVDLIKKEEIYSKIENEMIGYKNNKGKEILNNLHTTFMKEDILNKSKIDVFVKRKIKENSFKIVDENKMYFLLDNNTYVLNNSNNKILNNKLLTFLNKGDYKGKTYFKYDKSKHQLIVIKNEEMKYIRIPNKITSLSYNKLSKVINSI